MFSGARHPQQARTAVRLLPREEEFFDLFVEVATRSTVAAQHLRELFDAPPDRRIAHVEAIKRLEHEADQVTHEVVRSEEHTSELQSQSNLVCRLLLEKKKNHDDISSTLGR